MKEWLQALQAKWEELQSRERQILLVGAVFVIGAVLYGGILLPLSHSKANMEKRVSRARSDLQWMQGAVGQIKTLRSQGKAPQALKGSLLATVDASARQAGLSQSVKSLQQDSGNSVRARLEDAPFDTVLQWIGRLKDDHGIQVDSLDLDQADDTGKVNASVVLRHD